MLEYHHRNPFLIIIFTFLGMLVRFMLFYPFSYLIGKTPKNLWSFSEGFKQIVYNILLTFLIFTGFLFYMIYDIIN